MTKILRQAALYACVALTATALLYICSATVRTGFVFVGKCVHSDSLCSLAACFPIHIFTPSVSMAVFWCIDCILAFSGCWLAKTLWQAIES